MNEEQLYEIADFILNKATTAEIEVLIAAIKKRLTGTKGPLGLDPAKMARSVSDSINDNIDSTLHQVHEHIQGYMRKLIKQEVPDIPEEHLRELIDTWAPDPHGKNSSGDRNESAAGLPPDVLLTMAKQFLSYSLGAMSLREQQRLREEIPDWYEVYWQRFPPGVKKLLSLIIKGEIDEQQFWKRLSSELGLDDYPL